MPCVITRLEGISEWVPKVHSDDLQKNLQDCIVFCPEANPITSSSRPKTLMDNPLYSSVFRILPYLPIPICSMYRIFPNNYPINDSVVESYR